MSLEHNFDIIKLHYNDNYVLDNTHIYITCGPIHDNRNLGDWFNTILHHISFNLKNNYNIIICVNNDCLELAIILFNTFECIKKILIADDLNIINKFTFQKNLHYEAMINIFNLDFNWTNIKTNWHDIHYNFLYTLGSLNNNNNFDIFKNTIVRFQNAIKKLDNIDCKKYTNTLCIYPYRSDGYFIPEHIIQNLYTNYSDKKIIIHLNKKSFDTDFNFLHSTYKSLIEKYNIIFITFSFTQLFSFLNNSTNILLINRCGLSEILYWSNSIAKVYVHIPQDLLRFSYDSNNNNHLNILQKFEKLNITTSFKDLY
jgi:hypothetical protein